MKKKCHLLVWEPRNWGLLVAWKDGETEKKRLTSLESVWKKKIVPKTEKLRLSLVFFLLLPSLTLFDSFLWTHTCTTEVELGLTRYPINNTCNWDPDKSPLKSYEVPQSGQSGSGSRSRPHPRPQVQHLAGSRGGCFGRGGHICESNSEIAVVSRTYIGMNMWFQIFVGTKRK